MSEKKVKIKYFYLKYWYLILCAIALLVVCLLYTSHYDRKKRGEDYYYSEPVDMVSRMYPPYSWMAEEYFKDPREYRPLVLCEYCHSMGNSPGDFKDYWDIIYSSDRYMGAFVWEWADHGVLYGDKGLRYGGDFGETLHDGNFCMDGIITADRKLTQKSMEMKKAYEPVRFNLQDGKLTVKSLNYFMPVSYTHLQGRQRRTSRLHKTKH